MSFKRRRIDDGKFCRPFLGRAKVRVPIVSCGVCWPILTTAVNRRICANRYRRFQRRKRSSKGGSSAHSSVACNAALICARVCCARLDSLRAQLGRLITTNENISVLLSGGRGSGKTLVLRTALKELRGKYPRQPMVELYLNGDCVRDDSSAVRQIALQLRHASNSPVGFADGINPRNFAESMAELRIALRQSVANHSCGGAGRPIVLILDEFDRFATQNRQMLLYNLYNLIHDAGSRVAVVGVTSCHDAMDHLEKRVKSRFSQRTILFPPFSSCTGFVQVLGRSIDDAS